MGRDKSRPQKHVAGRATATLIWWAFREYPPDPIEWIERAVNLDADKTSAAGGLIHLESYQREPILAQFDPTCREVVIVAIEQTGKSTCWRLPTLYRAVHAPGPAWIVYESDEKAEDINAEQFDPLVKSIPDLAALLTRTSATRRRYSLENGCVIDFGGAGCEITSKPRRDVVADELDGWRGSLSRSAAERNLNNLRKRCRTYWANNEGCMIIVSSPIGLDDESLIWAEFEESSKAYWHLRCNGCGKPTIPSHATYLLQWKLDDGGAVIPDTYRLHCPACGHQHTEDEAQAMTDAGEYVSKHPERKYKRGFQWGALASPRVLKWWMVAEAQLKAGSTGTIEGQRYFDNSVRGLPWKPRRTDKKGEAAIRARCAPFPDASKIANVIFAADTQDNGWFWLALAIMQNRDVHILANGKTPLVRESLIAAWNQKHMGILPAMGIIDEGGHHGRLVQEIAMETTGLYAYKGNPRIGKPYKLSEGEKWRLLAMPGIYQSQALYMIYVVNEAGGRLFLPPDPDAELVAHLGAMRPPEAGHRQYEKWTSGGDPDHYFAALRMGLAMLDFARDNVKNWRVSIDWGRAVKPKPARRSAPQYEEA